MRRTRRKPGQTATCASGIANFELHSSSTALYGCLSLSLSLSADGGMCAQGLKSLQKIKNPPADGLPALNQLSVDLYCNAAASCLQLGFHEKAIFHSTQVRRGHTHRHTGQDLRQLSMGVVCIYRR